MKTVIEKIWSCLFGGRIRSVIACSFVTLSGLCMHAATRGAQAGTAVMPVAVRIIKTLDVTVTASLNFGTIAVAEDSQAGTAVIDPASGAISISGAGMVSSIGGAVQAGRLQVKSGARPFTVSLAQSAIALSNGSSTVEVTDFNFVTANQGSVVNITPSVGSPTVSVPLGATLKTKVAQLEGNYIGTTNVFANYQ